MTNHTSAGNQPSGCVYCTGVFGNPILRDPWNHRLIQDELACAVVPTRGMLVAGWTLVIPEEHNLSVRGLSAFQRTLTLLRLAQAVDLVEREFGPATIFEHGAVTANSVVGCGVDHAHMHVVPLDFDLVAAAKGHPLGRSLDWKRLPTRTETEWFESPAYEPYLFVKALDQSWVATGNIPSQFFRRVIALKLGRPDSFDWRKDSGLELVEETRARLLGSTAVSV